MTSILLVLEKNGNSTEIVEMRARLKGSKHKLTPTKPGTLRNLQKQSTILYDLNQGLEGEII